MKPRDAATDDGSTLTVRVPLTLRKHGGRKQVVLPDGGSWGAPRPRIDNAMVKAIARAHRWRRLLETGQFASVTELAEAEKINESYLARVLRLTLLAPNIVEAVLDGRQPPDLTLGQLLRPFLVEWRSQRESLWSTVRHAPRDVSGEFLPASSALRRS